MNDARSDRRAKPEVIPFPIKQAKRKAPRRSGPGMTAVSGNLALALDPAQAPQQKPLAFPTPSRWFSESHGAIGFRLFDIVYLFSLARQALTAEDALEWGARYFAGAMSEEHGHRVLEVLAPGQEELPGWGEIDPTIRQAFREAILQGAGRVLEQPRLELRDVTEERAKELQQRLEALYERNGWLLPTLPLTLHRLLRYSKKFEY